MQNLYGNLDDGDLDIDNLTQSLNQTSCNAMKLESEIRGFGRGRGRGAVKKKKKKVKVIRKAKAIPKELDWSSINNEVLNELNKVRANPSSLIPRLEFILKNMKNKVYYPPNSKIGLVYKEGRRGLMEAINFLKKQKRRRALVMNDGLSDAANVHVKDQSVSGGTGHIGANGSKPSERINKVHMNQKWKRGCAENIMYGRENGRDIVCALIVDDGVKSRGHRTNMFSDDWNMVGISSGSHPKFRTMCVIDFAVDYGPVSS